MCSTVVYHVFRFIFFHLFVVVSLRRAMMESDDQQQVISLSSRSIGSEIVGVVVVDEEFGMMMITMTIRCRITMYSSGPRIDMDVRINMVFP